MALRLVLETLVLVLRAYLTLAPQPLSAAPSATSRRCPQATDGGALPCVLCQQLFWEAETLWDQREPPRRATRGLSPQAPHQQCPRGILTLVSSNVKQRLGPSWPEPAGSQERRPESTTAPGLGPADPRQR